MSKRRQSSNDNDVPAYTDVKKPRLGDSESIPTEASQQKRANEDYTVGWICAIEPEYLAAQLCLDEKHPRPTCRPSPNDTNAYTLGKINGHNVVIACLPDGSYGTSSAANVATNLLRSFPNVRIGLMVGIGGGAPTGDSDIRLGDIVVSSPADGKGGVFQHDFGKEIQEQDFQATGFLNRPPTALLTGLMSLRVDYRMKPGRLEEAIDRILENKVEEEELREELNRPDANTDILYRSNCTHPANSKTPCVQACGMDPASLVPPRLERKRPRSPKVHYGLIASGNRLMKNALHRDELAKKWKILCFEMEAAGLMNDFPCLVVRGICDYSDSHKNKEWQGYAAIAAAAYAKDLLSVIQPGIIEAEKKITEVLSVTIGIREIVEDHRDIARDDLVLSQKSLEIQQAIREQDLSDRQKSCLHLFRLTKTTEDATYEWYKDRVEERVEGTCTWFLKHDNFQEWVKQESGPLLVSADPGCGKSVLAKYLVDHVLPPLATICYFFFKDQDQNTVRQALCALLHQLFSQKPVLIQHAMKQFDKDGPGIVDSTNSLWTILTDAVQDSQAGPVIIVLDALDECFESEFKDLMRNVESQSRSSRGKLKYLLTSRPYDQIISMFQGMSADSKCIRIPGEEEPETISHEVNLVIKYRVERLAKKKTLSDNIKSYLTTRLLEGTHRTYLWVYLVFNHLETEGFKKTAKGVDSAIEVLPKSVPQAYEQILNKCKEQPMVQKALAVILAANRPLTLSEMNVAVSIDNKTQSIYDLDLEEEEDFKLRLRSWCGLFVSIHHGKIYLLHQTAREFLLADSPVSTTLRTQLQWEHSITIPYANIVLAELCVRYLSFFNSNIASTTDTSKEDDHRIDSHSFLDYSAQFWGLHFHTACIGDSDDVMIQLALGILGPDSKSRSMWYKIYWDQRGETPTFLTDVMIASYFGHIAVVRRLVDEGANVNAQGGRYGNALQAASEGGHEQVVKLLLEKNADVNAQGGNYGNALQAASSRGHEQVVKLLLEKNANINAQGGNYGNALQAASEGGHEQVVKLLLEKNADVNAQGGYYGNALYAASSRGHKQVVKLLLARGFIINRRV